MAQPCGVGSRCPARRGHLRQDAPSRALRLPPGPAERDNGAGLRPDLPVPVAQREVVTLPPDDREEPARASPEVAGWPAERESPRSSRAPSTQRRSSLRRCWSPQTMPASASSSRTWTGLRGYDDDSIQAAATGWRPGLPSQVQSVTQSVTDGIDPRAAGAPAAWPTRACRSRSRRRRRLALSLRHALSLLSSLLYHCQSRARRRSG
jgi:hypothetical protein